MPRYVLDLHDLDRTQVAIVGGKAANLGELARIEGIQVPSGYCVTTAAFERVIASDVSIGNLIDRLSRLQADDREAIRSLSAELRQIIELIEIPDDLATAITRPLGVDKRGGPHDIDKQGGRHDIAYAVRSSATAEDQPTASFAGQLDSYLNVVGSTSILQHIRRCWASLFSARAVAYRQRQGIDHRTARMAVIVQRMVPAQAAGVLFTADPVTGNRKRVAIEAVRGLGDALVSGHANAESVLTDAQIAQLTQLGQGIEAQFGRPQDIEWCLVDDAFHIVQSRPITTLFPIPESPDNENHVYVSVGHQQMMTDPVKPLGISIWQLTAPIPMPHAGGRMFVDITARLASPQSRADIVMALGRSDPLIGDALQTILDRGDFIRPLPDTSAIARPIISTDELIKADATIVDELIARSEAATAALNREISAKSGPELFDFIASDLGERRRLLFDPRSQQVVMAVIQATWWLNDHLFEWLGDKNAADVLTQSVPHNVTSEMGLALLDVADAIRPHAEVVAFLERVEGDDFLEGLSALPGGSKARAAIISYLDKYGMRCVGEIDITRPRWSERPGTLVPLILSNIRNFEPGESTRRFEKGAREASDKEAEVLARVRALPDGERKAEETKQMIDRVRTFAGYREYPKYSLISLYFIYKRAMLREAEHLVNLGVIAEREDVFFLTLQEFSEAVRTERVDAALIRERKHAFVSYHALTPPRVLTSDGEAVVGSYHRDDFPEGALVGLAVSAGTIEGRARVIADIAEADDLKAGDILVTAFTDPSWTPLFVSVRGLVTEVGGLMTHGAVIAREYGLPAVVGVSGATRLIRDGQRIRVNGTDGYVEILT